MDHTKLMADFVGWYTKQFPRSARALLTLVDGEFTDETVNALWIGFCAGRLTAS